MPPGRYSGDHDHRRPRRYGSQHRQNARHRRRSKSYVTGSQSKRSTDALEEVPAHRCLCPARAPNKLRLVRAMQASKQVVSMTGDGVNGSRAKQADVASPWASKARKFPRRQPRWSSPTTSASITAAVREGRGLQQHRESHPLSCFPPTAAGPHDPCGDLLGLVLPITPPQILWINGDLGDSSARHIF